MPHSSTRRRRLPLAGLAFFCSASLAQPTLHPFRCADGRFGFADNDLKPVIACAYEEVRPFQGAVAAVARDGRWGVIDARGKLVRPFEAHLLELVPTGRATLVLAHEAYNAWWRVNDWRVLPEWNILSTSSGMGPLLSTHVPRTRWRAEVLGGGELASLNYPNPSYDANRDAPRAEHSGSSVFRVPGGNHFYVMLFAREFGLHEVLVYRDAPTPVLLERRPSVLAVLHDGTLLQQTEQGAYASVRWSGDKLVEGERLEHWPLDGQPLFRSQVHPGHVYWLSADDYGRTPRALAGRLVPTGGEGNKRWLDIGGLGIDAVIAEAGGDALGVLIGDHVLTGRGLRADAAREITLPAGLELESDYFDPSYREPYLIVRQGERYGLWDTRAGRLALPVEFELLRHQRDGVLRYAVKTEQGNRYGLIDASGRRITPPLYFDLHGTETEDYVWAVPPEGHSAGFFVEAATGRELRAAR